MTRRATRPIRPWPILLLLASVFLSPSRATADDGTDFFEKHVRPILIDNCYNCHSTSAPKLKGGLLLDTKAGTDAGGDNGPVLVRGDPAKSKIIEAVRWTNPDLQMPPKKKLSEQQIADLVTWVKMGAPDPRTGDAVAKASPFDVSKARQWWAFQPPKAVTPPAVKNAAWPQSAIDAFILAKLEEHNLPPAKPADKRALIRRATFDLIGLPPTEAEVDAFVADASPDAFAKVVDRLLANPHYGEKWGRHWLDVVRYTDSFDSRGMGGMTDVPDAWRYRDWVVKAFNADLSYDRFVRTQIAGDLMTKDESDDASRFDDLIATGMYVIGNWPGTDADKEKMLTDIVDDQIDVTGRAFLGLTLACARCHDHKFDPISTADYYGLAGIFFSSHILPNSGAKTAISSVLQVPLASESEVALRKAYDEKLADLQKKVDGFTDDYRNKAGIASLKHLDGYLQCAWENRNKNNAVAVTRYALQHDLDPQMARLWADFLAPHIGAPDAQRKFLKRSIPGVQGHAGLDGWYPADTRQIPDVLVNRKDEPIALGNVAIPPYSVNLHPGQDTDVAVGWKTAVARTVKVHLALTDTDPGCGDGVAWRLELCSGHVTRELASGDIANTGSATVEGGKLDAVALKADDTIQLVIDAKGDYNCDTTRVELTIAEPGGQSWDLTRNVLANERDFWQFYELSGRRNAPIPEGSLLAQWIEKAVAPDASADDMRQASKRLRDAVVALQLQADEIRKSGKDPFSATAGGLAGPDALVYQTITAANSPFWGGMKMDGSDLPPSVREKRAAIRMELDDLKHHPPAPLPMAHAIQDGGTPDSPYDKITDARIHIRGRYDRLGDLIPRRLPVVLAGENQTPISKQTTGSGRVQLADWVASKANPLTARVMVNRIWQWHFGVGIVRTPSNFGKLGTPPSHPELLDYLATRFVDGGWSVKAMHRLIMLSAAYQQSTVPDPATFKADPANLLFGHMNRRRLEAEEIRDALVVSTDNLIPSMGGPSNNDLNTPRRTMYMTTVRSDRATFRTLFDAADPTSITDVRLESTVAPQALFLLNHPFVVGKADSLAKVVNYELTLDDRAKVDWLYHRLYARAPRPAEIDLGLKAVEQLGWPGYCQVLLCANEFVYVD